MLALIGLVYDSLYVLLSICATAVTAHIWKEKHVMDYKPVLLKQASNKQELTNWENILMTKK